MKINKIIKEHPMWTYMLSERETRRVADLLENSIDFEKSIIYLRKKYNIPVNGYPFDLKKHPIEWIMFDTIDEFFEESSRITEEVLNLPSYWMGGISYFAFYDVLITPERMPIWVKAIKQKGDHSHSLHIVLQERMSKAEVHKWIDEIWNDIEENMQSIPTAKKHKMLRSEIAKRIVDMKDKQDMKFRQIADKLQEDYQDSDFYDVLNENNIKTLYHRWKTKINE